MYFMRLLTASKHTCFLLPPSPPYLSLISPFYPSSTVFLLFFAFSTLSSFCTQFCSLHSASPCSFPLPPLFVPLTANPKVTSPLRALFTWTAPLFLTFTYLEMEGEKGRPNLATLGSEVSCPTKPLQAEKNEMSVFLQKALISGTWQLHNRS